MVCYEQIWQETDNILSSLTVSTLQLTHIYKWEDREKINNEERNEVKESNSLIDF